MKLSETKLRQIVREEISLLSENRVKLSRLEDKYETLAVVSPKSYPTAYDRIEKYLEREGYETRMFDFYVVDDPRKSIEDMKIWQGSGAVDGRTAMSKHVMQLQESNGVTDYYAQFQQYLSSVGTALRGGYGEFEYKGYRVVTSDGDFFLTVSLFRDKYDEEPAAKARIEDGGVRYKKPAGVTGRPQIRKEMYRSPEQVMKDLVEMAEN